MSLRPVPEEPTVLRDTAAQDRMIERAGFLRRHRTPLLLAAAAAVFIAVLLGVLLHFSGAGRSVDRSRIAIAAVERGSFIRDIAADGRVVAANSATLYADAPGTVTLQVHAGDAVVRGQQLAVVASPDLAAKLAQEEATAVGLRIDWQRASLDAERRQKFR